MLACKKYNIIICVYVNMLTCIIWWGKYMNMIIMVIWPSFLPSFFAYFLIRNIFFGSIFFLTPIPPSTLWFTQATPDPSGIFWHTTVTRLPGPGACITWPRKGVSAIYQKRHPSLVSTPSIILFLGADGPCRNTAWIPTPTSCTRTHRHGKVKRDHFIEHHKKHRFRTQ